LELLLLKLLLKLLGFVATSAMPLLDVADQLSAAMEGTDDSCYGSYYLRRALALGVVRTNSCAGM
jgi:hypothetical protein